MFKDKTLRRALLGNTHGPINDPKDCRVQAWHFPADSFQDHDRNIKFPSADGLVLYLIKRIENVENQVRDIRNQESKRKVLNSLRDFFGEVSHIINEEPDKTNKKK